MAPSHVQVFLDIWFSFHIVGGHFLIPVLLVTFLLSKAKRDVTLVNLGVTLSLSSVCNCLLSVLPRPPPFSPLTYTFQGSMRINTLAPNQTRDCVFYRPRRLAHPPPCTSSPIPACFTLNAFCVR